MSSEKREKGAFRFGVRTVWSAISPGIASLLPYTKTNHTREKITLVT